jgi:hypothetical protein
MSVNRMSERDHGAHIGALNEMVQVLESDVLTVCAVLSRGDADNFAKIPEPASIKSRLKDVEHDFGLALMHL